MGVDAAIKTQLATGAVKMVWLVEIEFATHLRLTNAEHVIHYGGKEYTPWPWIAVSAPKEDQGGGISVTLPDDGTIDAIERADDAAGRVMTVTRLYLTRSGLKAVQEWSGTIENYDSDNYSRCVFRSDSTRLLRIGPAMPIWNDTCINDFKSARCGYAGATTTCDGTWAACQAMDGGANTANWVAGDKAPTPGEVVVLGGQRYVVGGYEPAPTPDPPGTAPRTPTSNIPTPDPMPLNVE